MWTVHAGSVKACFGHSEGAAGIHGALLALLAVAKRAAPPVVHARSLNPYVDAAVADWRQTHGVTAMVPRVQSTTALSCLAHICWAESLKLQSTWPLVI